ncbi:phage tail protein [Chitinophaga agri]|uniref:Tail fiber protein n=1 Tax=Chitinophaga agri TaxID=2703787 RepID=A0A6B9Z8V9_9BACT|nr:phage tail protein [Chitinophaga agri]QHS58416.1 tail fiber protein [Chitinophaga agri]
MKHFFITAFVCATTIGKINAQSQTNALNISANGNVGIGTETPSEKLQVDGNIKSNSRFIDKSGSVMPVGAVIPYAGSTPPPGWVFCDGTSYPKAGDQKELFDVIGTTYGGDANTFRVPDLRGTFIQGTGLGDGLGLAGGAEQHSHSVWMPERTFSTTPAGIHSHRFPTKWYFRGFAKGGFTGIDTGGDDVTYQATQDSGNHAHQVTVTGLQLYTSSTTGKTRPKWLALNYIIKY